MPDEASRTRRAVPEEVADQLCAQIAAGELRPGDRLPGERELAERFRVNRGSVREALKKLEQLRLIEIQQGAGTRVRDPQQASFDFIATQLSRDDKPQLSWVRDLAELRQLLAGGLVRSALTRARADQLDDLARSIRALADAGLREAAFAQALWVLPSQLARASGNRVLELLANSVTRFLSEPAVAEAGAQVVAAERTSLRNGLVRLAVALEARDPERAEQAASDLMGRLGDQTLRTLGVVAARTGELVPASEVGGSSEA